MSTIQDTTNQLNQLLAQSSDALLCGPDCQKMRKTDQLRQQYLDAQANVETAPFHLEDAEKSYYMFTGGTSEYDKIRKEQLEKDASAMIASTKATFQQEMENARDLGKTHENLSNTYENTLELYQNYLLKNSDLQKQLHVFKGDTITNDRKSFYESQGVDSLKKWYILWKWIYICVVASFIIGFFLAKSNYGIISRLLILVGFIVYPFLIQPLFRFIYGVVQQIFSYLPKNIYM